MTHARYALGAFGLVLLTAGGVNLTAQRGMQERRPAPISMSGTYALDTTRGDDARSAANQATWAVPPPQRGRAHQRLLSRLQSPATLAIDRHGRTVTIGSSDGPRTMFDADGLDRNEPGRAGRTVVTRAELAGDRLSVSTRGDRDSDFIVTFESIDNGSGLLVTRQMDSLDLEKPITVHSYYRRVDAQPRWDVYAPDRSRRSVAGPRAFSVPDGTRIVAVLETPLSTRTARSGEHFSMTVRSPAAYAGARIDGVIARITPYGPGSNADLRVDFDTIQLRNGQSAELDAILENVRTPGGVTLRVDASGTTPDVNRGTDPVQQGAIGAALGAVIGVIVGGGKGAAVGAVLGGVSGAIMAQDHDQYLDLPPNTQVTITVTTTRDPIR